MKEKSAMQTLMDYIDTEFEFSSFSEHKYIRHKAESLLADEKKQIVEAYTTAQIEIVSIVTKHFKSEFPDTNSLVNDILNGEDSEDALDYYSDKFE